MQLTEANAMSNELDKGVAFELLVRSGASHDPNDKSKTVRAQQPELDFLTVINRRQW